MAISIVQTSGLQSGAATLNITLNNVAAGNTLVVYAWCVSTVDTTMSVSDNKSDSFHTTNKQNGGATLYGCCLSYALNVAGGNTQISIAETNGDTVYACAVEVSGLVNSGQPDGSSSASGSSGSPAPGGVTTTNAQDYAAAVFVEKTSGTPNTPVGYNNEALRTTSPVGQAIDQILNATGTYNPTWTWASGGNSTWAAIQIILKGPAGAVPPKIVRPPRAHTFPRRPPHFIALFWPPRPGPRPIQQGNAQLPRAYIFLRRPRHTTVILWPPRPGPLPVARLSPLPPEISINRLRFHPGAIFTTIRVPFPDNTAGRVVPLVMRGDATVSLSMRVPP